MTILDAAGGQLYGTATITDLNYDKVVDTWVEVRRAEGPWESNYVACKTDTPSE